MRDLKPENILLGSDGYIKVTDFGLSKLSKTGGVVVGTTFCGTAEYLSPEQLRNQPHGVEVDYWALGVIAYELMAGLPPFYNRDHKTMFKLILKGEPKFNESIFSQQAQSFIRQCLEKDPKKRLGTGGNFAQFKAHPWFSKLDWEKLYQKQYDLDYKPEKHLNANNVDLSNFDTRFTNQQINMEDVMGLDKTDITNQELFEGFDVDSKIVEKILQEKMKKAEKEQIENMQMMGCADDHESQSTSQQQQRKRDVSQKKKKVRQEDEDLDQELSM
ncbi:Kinase [Hexamita inflata]|uniref:Kinase n=1 Tax=Hexamita inflata TaxID=28002 RepID=A0ABP1KSR3_9EUKA